MNSTSFTSRNFKKKNRLVSSRSRGFSLVELLVSIAILVGVLSVVLSGQSTYAEGASLSNLADNVGASISQAQIYGVSVREVGAGSGIFTSAYGVSFAMPAVGGSNNAYIFFADLNNNRVYDSGWACPIGGGSECQEKIFTTRNNTINSLCVIYSNGTENCTVLNRADITFLRPETEARLALFNSAGNNISASGVNGVRINLRSQSGLTRSIIVYTTGQISVQ